MLSILLTLATLLTLSISPPPPRPVLIHRPKCWTDSQTLLRPAVFAECRDNARSILRTQGLDPDIPLKFSADPATRPDVKLPTAWGHRRDNCDIWLQANPPGTRKGSDRTTLRQVEEAAMTVALECVIKPPHLGGLVVLGWNDKLAVNVINFGPEDEINDNRTLSAA
ncbi:MAG: hypothetical protein Q9182_004587 [Xanthomendoza sp. 2 TL-2023]